MTQTFVSDAIPCDDVENVGAILAGSGFDRIALFNTRLGYNETNVNCI
jgi:hypothetical protein